MRATLILAAALTLSLTAVAAGAEKPVNVSLFNPVQLVNETDDVRGVRLNLIYGRNVNVTGLDIGFIAGHATGNFSGVQWHPINLVDGSFTGWQNGWLLARTRGDFVGVQSASINIGSSRNEGIQFGLVNVAAETSGIQIGIVNVTDRMYGLQIGLVNVIESKDSLPILPIVNWRF